MPIELTLIQNSVQTYLLAFDGRVLELFDNLSPGKTHRHHVALLASVGLLADKKGQHILVIEALDGYKEILIVPDDRLSVVQQLVAEVQQAMARDR